MGLPLSSRFDGNKDVLKMGALSHRSSNVLNSARSSNLKRMDFGDQEDSSSDSSKEVENDNNSPFK